MISLTYLSNEKKINKNIINQGSISSKAQNFINGQTNGYKELWSRFSKKVCKYITYLTKDTKTRNKV